MKRVVATFFSMIYLALLNLSQACTRRLPNRIKKVGARVISVGNITWGGTGKTPLVARLCQDLAEMGKRPAILTRGYGKDEVLELKKRLPNIPILVGRDRVKTAREAVAKHQAEFLILDDGFQHIRLHRDLDIVNINSTSPFGPGGLIPKGTLREPLENLKRADVFVLTKSNIGSKNLHWIKQRLLEIKPGAVIFEAVHRPVQFMDFKRNRFVPLESVKGKKVATISGIGDPYSFEKTVESLGTEILLAARFDDHHGYTVQELKDFMRRAKEVGIKEVITTEKDFYRMEPLLKGKKGQDENLFNPLVLQIEFELADEEDFLRRCVNP
ncbi:MAG: tetraacyldisaccharide 4'-kinase [Candidatus Omnitrophica bacterium]|nr:tetraacyldisaccharide 4'-kinase [Candidatus Omnitrophota bacterium]